MKETMEQIYKDANRQIKCIREYLITCHDPEDQKALKKLIIKLQKIGSFLTKRQIASVYGIDVRTFNKRMKETGCTGAMFQLKQGNWEYKKCKMFTLQDIDMIYEYIGTPSSYKN